ncbi:MAG: hypothetical protein M3Y39_13530 [Chloroflexota bacterium]|nr:hypothetical protein [Chloroflexota bacterium]
MKTLARHPMRMRLEMVMIAFFLLAALSLLVVYLADPSIYAQSLSLTFSPANRYPVPVTLFLVGILAVIALLILGVVRHWRWLFWLLLVAFGLSILELPATLLQLTGNIPDSYPAWYSLSRLGVALLQFGIAVWMFQIYRHHGVWALGKKASRHA